MSKAVVLVTGASSGIGFETALALKRKNYVVYGAARRTERLKELEKRGINTIAVDVTDEESMLSCMETIASHEGRIDILINNAGYGSYGAVEDVPIEEAKRQFDVNVFGLARMSQLALPYMRKQGYGRIINISSMGGKLYTPFGGWYHATKYAVEALSDCLRMETEAHGIDVVIIEPGGINTQWGVIAADNLEKVSENGPYEEEATRLAKRIRKRYTGYKMTEPKVIADTIVTAVMVKKPKTRYLVGYGAKPSVLLRKLLPDRLFDKLVSKLF